MASQHEAASHITGTATETYPLLDFLRFGAALAVMLAHLRDVFFAPYSVTASSLPAAKYAFFMATRLGQEAVILFFVISGFLVGGSCIRRMKAGRFSLLRYGIDRVTRIYIPLLPMLAFTFAEVYFFAGRHNFYALLMNALSLQGVVSDPIEGGGVLWSLSYEVWFYILAGAFCLILTSRSAFAGLCAAIAALLGFLVFTRLLPVYLLVWVLGAMFFCISRPRKFLLLTAAAILVTIAGIGMMEVSIQSHQVDLARFAAVDPNVAILVCALGWSLIILLAGHKNASTPVMKAVAPVGASLAAFSYTLYLFHLPVELLLISTGWLKEQSHHVLNLISLLEYLGTAALILAGCYGFYWLAERHTGEVRNLLYRWAGVTARAAVWRERYPT